MTTRKFSAISLPHPKYSLEIGRISLNEQQHLNLPKWIPRFSDKIQLIEVKRSALLGVNAANNSIFMGSYVVIENVRPELFLRRDFISRFVDKGTVNISSQVDGMSSTGVINRSGYHLYTCDNVLTFLFDEKTYRRFGLIGRRVISGERRTKRKSSKNTYRVDVNLRNSRIKEDNKYQDKLVQIFRTLHPIRKVYFRFVPVVENDSKTDKDDQSHELERSSSPVRGDVEHDDDHTSDESVEFFRYIIKEYAMDGFQFVPLTDCHKVCHKLERRWTNYNQRLPKLDLRRVNSYNTNAKSSSFNSTVTGSTKEAGGDSAPTATTVKTPGLEKNVEVLSEVVNLIDWFGYQLLELSCDQKEICSTLSSDHEAKRFKGDTEERVNVSCALISGITDFEEVENNLSDYFISRSQLEKKVVGGRGIQQQQVDQLLSLQTNTLFRALILYKELPSFEGGKFHEQGTSGVALLQDCSGSGREGDDDLITIIGMSGREQ